MIGLNAKGPLVKKVAGLTAILAVMGSVSLADVLTVRQDQKNHDVDLPQVLAKDLKMRNCT